MDYLIPIVVVSILIAINGLFVAAEFAVAGASRPRIAYLAEQGSGIAHHVLEIVSDQQRISDYLATAQVGITIASLGLGMYAEPTIAHWLFPVLESIGIHSQTAVHTVATTITVALLTYFHVVLGEMVPKSLALQNTDTAAIRLYPFMAFSQKLFGPLTAILNRIGNWLLVLLRMPPADSGTHLVTRNDLSYIVEASLEGGLLEPSERVFLENVIDFHERSVGQVMTPRNRMIALPVDKNLSELLDEVCGQPYSRFPMYEVSRDQIVGILHLKDLARSSLRKTEEFSLNQIIRPALFVPESLALDEMLGQFRAKNRQTAIVVDEYGGTAGLITLEDLAEEIIGEIQDEYDEEIAPFQIVTSGTLRVRGDLLLDELDQHFDIEFDMNDAETVGGLVMSELGRVPKPGDRIHVGELIIEVESMAGLALDTAVIKYDDAAVADTLTAKRW